MLRTPHRTASLALAAAVALTAASAAAETIAQAEAAKAPVAQAKSAAAGSPQLLPGLTVVGSPEQARTLPGSAAFIATEDIKTQSYADIGRVLRQVPGVYVRDEDGFGLFPNISLRGVDTTRNSKLTVMEDGVLSAPAPYSAPAAYYSPNTARMSAIEILKGSSQIRYGPHTTGGVVNYLSTAIPTERSAYVKTLYGQRNEIRTHAYGGDTVATDLGNLGFLVEGFYRESDGFKKIDLTPDFREGNRTGFSIGEPMLKLAFEPKHGPYQRVEFKIGYSDIDIDEGYLGLAEEDFGSPNRRYSASRFDNIQTEHTRTFLRHTIAPVDALRVTTTAYYNKFRRNWFKLNDILLPNLEGTGTTTVSLSSALAGSQDGRALALLRGTEPGILRVRNNNRSYYLYGVDSVAEYDFEAGPTAQTIVAGVRLHTDRERRFQHDERFAQEANGTISARTVGAPGSAGNRREEARAAAVFVQDTISIGKFSVTPGVRWEHLWLESDDFGASPVFAGKREIDLVAGGVGATYDLHPEWRLFSGVHRGFSPPDPRAAIVDRLDTETSIGVELGVRHTPESGFFLAEATGFYTGFEDLIVIQNVGGAGTDRSENVGEVDTFGIELASTYDLGAAQGWSFSNPYFASFTYTHAELASDSNSRDAESIFAGGKKGNRVPYIPEIALSVGSSVDFERLGMSVTGFYVDDTFTTASNTSQQVDSNGNPDARFGKTDNAFLVDVASQYRLTDNLTLIAGVQNAFDKRYVVSRHPHGARPNQPIFGYGALEVTF